MIANFVEVIELAVLAAATSGLFFAQIDFKRRQRYRFYLASGLTLGGLLGIWSLISQLLPNFINRSEHRYRWQYVLSLACLLCFVFSFFRDRRDEKSRPVIGEGRALTAIFYMAQAMVTALVPVLLMAVDFVPYGGSFWETDVLVKVAGWFLGFVFLFLFAHIFRRAAEYSPKAGVLTLRILLLGQLLLAAGEILLRLYSKGFLPRERLLFQLLAAINNGHRAITIVILCLALVLPIWLLIKASRLKSFAENPAERRKLLAKKRAIRRWASGLIAFVLVAVFSLGFLYQWVNREVEISDPEEYELTDDRALVSLDLLADGHLHRFAYQADGGEQMRFIALQKSPGSYVAALDACDICGVSGYYERGDDIICKLCDVVMNRGTIGFPGGCNPIPLESQIEDDYLVVRREELEANADVFR